MGSIRQGTPSRDVWILVGLIVLAVGCPAIVGVLSGSGAIPHNDDFAYRRAATTFYETGRVGLTGWGVMTFVGQLVATMPLLWLTQGNTWAFGATTALFAIVGIVASFDLARRVLSPGFAASAVLLSVLVPGYLFYTTAYMTEIPSFAMEMSCLAIGASALTRSPAQHRWRWLAASVVVGCYAFSIREFALAAPVAVLVAAAASEREGRRLPYVIGLVAVGMSCAVIYWYASGLPGQVAVRPAMPTPVGVRRVLDAIPVAGLTLAPALLIAATTWLPHWWRAGHRLGMVAGGFVGAATAAVFYRDQLFILFGRMPGKSLDVFVGNVFDARGSLELASLAGLRPILYVAPIWDLVSLLALLATFGLLALLGAALVAERGRLRQALDIRSRPTPLGGVPGMLGAFVTLFAVGAVATGLTTTTFDRYVWPLILPLAILLLSRPATAASPASHPRTAYHPRSLIAAGALGVGVAAVSVALLFNAAAYDAARWRMGEEAVRRGFAPETIDAGLEWVGAHATGLADPRAARIPSMTAYAVKFPSYHQCAVVAASPLDFDGFDLAFEQKGAYRLLLFAGPREALYLYRVAGPGCPTSR